VGLVLAVDFRTRAGSRDPRAGHGDGSGLRPWSRQGGVSARTNNPASCRVATAAGHPAEGVARSAIRHGDQRFDVERHGRLAADLPITVNGLPVL